MLTKKDLLPLLEPDTLKKVARKYEIDADLRSAPSMIKALGKSKAVQVFHILLYVSEADKATILSNFVIPMDGDESLNTAVMRQSSRQREADELQEFYEYVYHHNFELCIEPYGRGIVLSNDDSKSFLLYPAEIRKLVQLLKKLDNMRGEQTGFNDNLLYSKDGFAIHELTTGFVLNKKRLSTEDTPHKDTLLSLRYIYVPYQCIILTMKEYTSRLISQVAFKAKVLPQVIENLEAVL